MSKVVVSFRCRSCDHRISRQEKNVNMWPCPGCQAKNPYGTTAVMSSFLEDFKKLSVTINAPPTTEVVETQKYWLEWCAQQTYYEEYTEEDWKEISVRCQPPALGVTTAAAKATAGAASAVTVPTGIAAAAAGRAGGDGKAGADAKTVSLTPTQAEVLQWTPKEFEEFILSHIKKIPDVTVDEKTGHCVPCRPVSTVPFKDVPTCAIRQCVDIVGSYKGVKFVIDVKRYAKPIPSSQLGKLKRDSLQSGAALEFLVGVGDETMKSPSLLQRAQENRAYLLSVFQNGQPTEWLRQLEQILYEFVY